MMGEKIPPATVDASGLKAATPRVRLRRGLRSYRTKCQRAPASGLRPAKMRACRTYIRITLALA
jgi:hypothetical protein